jgi:hypothetical protein
LELGFGRRNSYYRKPWCVFYGGDSGELEVKGADTLHAFLVSWTCHNLPQSTHLQSLECTCLGIWWNFSQSKKCILLFAKLHVLDFDLYKFRSCVWNNNKKNRTLKTSSSLDIGVHGGGNRVDWFIYDEFPLGSCVQDALESLFRHIMLG